MSFAVNQASGRQALSSAVAGPKMHEAGASVRLTAAPAPNSSSVVQHIPNHSNPMAQSQPAVHLQAVPNSGQAPAQSQRSFVPVPQSGVAPQVDGETQFFLVVTHSCL